MEIILHGVPVPCTLVPFVSQTLGVSEVQAAGADESTGTTTKSEVFPATSVADAEMFDPIARGIFPVVSHDHTHPAFVITGLFIHTFGERVTIDPGSAVPVIGFVFSLTAFTLGVLGACESTDQTVPVPLIFPTESVEVILTGPVVGIGFGTMLKLHDPFTIHVPTTTHPLFVIVIILPTSPVPVIGLKFVGRLIVGIAGGVLSIVRIVAEA